jgi:hypothetical protein
LKYIVQHSSIGAAGLKRTRVWKNLKQIIGTERSLLWENSDVTCKLNFESCTWGGTWQSG